ncbi:nitroreductase [Breznakia sp. PF5-3]|uniref:nitroreductase family protein n=1 Tax=unclassified Breznakia TaxID=2623764 RepID=UPI002404CCCB|nr:MULTISPECIES: nitroreductase family protein [unclassified Breznakia]MDF9825067.1 nitroreductase [Breznakia sp. PM6-1]MDF9835914.1 nitroreductase [Breznakia sp. PF5-3]MDF9837375.1 nitroreductase [Breznakia sp. PFB2-8]MDF9859310.1 nitroreductase [Breznakia sp. PH5-24]
MENQVLQNIRKRRSIRDFKKDQVPKELIETIVEAGLSAPYAERNSTFISVIQNKDILDEINDLAKATAVELAIEGLSDLGKDEEFHCLYQAPTLILVSAKEDSSSPDQDAGAVTQNMLLASESLNLGSCWLFYPILAFVLKKHASLKEKLNIPEGYKPCASLIVGYKSNENQEERTLNYNRVSYIF